MDECELDFFLDNNLLNQGSKLHINGTVYMIIFNNKLECYDLTHEDYFESKSIYIAFAKSMRVTYEKSLEYALHNIKWGNESLYDIMSNFIEEVKGIEDYVVKMNIIYVIPKQCNMYELTFYLQEKHLKPVFCKNLNFLDKYIE